MSGGRAAKSEATQERILAAALELFAEKGYNAATMRGVAERAECSLGLAYRYFKSKDAMVIALYRRLLSEYAEAASKLGPGTLAKRWGIVVRQDYARLSLHRNALAGLTAAGLTPGSGAQVLGEESRPIRLQMLNIFEALVTGSSDVPRSVDARSLASVLYGLHLLLVLFWLQDPTPGQRATAGLVDVCEEYMSWLRLLARLPGFGRALQRLTGILRPIMEGEPAADGGVTPTFSLESS